MDNDPFKDSVCEVLEMVDGVRCRPMFRRFGLYYRENLIGIISDSMLFLKTDETTQRYYLERHMKPYDEKDAELKNFYQVPADAVLDAEKLQQLAAEASAVKSLGVEEPYRGP